MDETRSTTKLSTLFASLIAGSFIVLLLYRTFINQPVWFDEIFFKSVLFGGPVWIYAWKSRRSPYFFGFEKDRFWIGAFNGLAIGGVFSFIALVASAVEKGQVLVPYLFNSPSFWSQFGLAFATAWWESLFFYGLVLSVLADRFKNEWISCGVATLIFLLFHAPVLILRGGWASGAEGLALLAFFAFGQAILFLRTRSISSVIVSHAFWGMALLVYGSN